jgi:hypothetical protein
VCIIAISGLEKNMKILKLILLLAILVAFSCKQKTGDFSSTNQLDKVILPTIDISISESLTGKKANSEKGIETTADSFGTNYSLYKSNIEGAVLQSTIDSLASYNLIKISLEQTDGIEIGMNYSYTDAGVSISKIAYKLLEINNGIATKILFKRTEENTSTYENYGKIEVIDTSDNQCVFITEYTLDSSLMNGYITFSKYIVGDISFERKMVSLKNNEMEKIEEVQLQKKSDDYYIGRIRTNSTLNGSPINLNIYFIMMSSDSCILTYFDDEIGEYLRVFEFTDTTGNVVFYKYAMETKYFPGFTEGKLFWDDDYQKPLYHIAYMYSLKSLSPLLLPGYTLFISSPDFGGNRVLWWESDQKLDGRGVFDPTSDLQFGTVLVVSGSDYDKYKPPRAYLYLMNEASSFSCSTFNAAIVVEKENLIKEIYLNRDNIFQDNINQVIQLSINDYSSL